MHAFLPMQIEQPWDISQGFLPLRYKSHEEYLEVLSPFLILLCSLQISARLQVCNPITMAKTLTLITTDLLGSPKQFPEYFEPFETFEPFPVFDIEADFEIMADLDSPAPPINKAVEQIIRTPGRQPSPQPTHFSIPNEIGKGNNGNGHRVLRSATVGYIAPEFKGKMDQMIQG